MQRIFIVKEVAESKNKEGNFSKVNEFLGKKGKIISITPFGITTQDHGGESEEDGYIRVPGRLLIVADNGDSVTL